MPTEEGVGLDAKREQGCLPMRDMAREEKEPEANQLRTSRLFDLALKDEELVAEECILGNQVRLGASQVGGSAENHRIVDRLSKMQESLFKIGDETDKQMGSAHGRGVTREWTLGEPSKALGRLYLAFRWSQTIDGLGFRPDTG